MKRIATLLLTALFLIGAGPSGSSVLMIVHAPLTYENGRDIPVPVLASIHRSLGALGAMVDHRGNGSWLNPQRFSCACARR